MKVYLASWYASRDDMRSRAKQLEDAGIEVTSRWLQENGNLKSTMSEVNDDFLRFTAGVDIEDIIKANVVILNTPSIGDITKADMPICNWARGGRHFEAGFQYALMMFINHLPIDIPGSRSLIVVGCQENVFYYLDSPGMTAKDHELPVIHTFPTWEEAFNYTVELAHASQLSSTNTRA